MRRLAVAASARALFAIRILMLVIGLSAAVAVSWTFQTGVEFEPLQALLALPRHLAFAFLPAAILSFAAMPPYMALVRRIPEEERANVPAPMLFLVVGLAVCALPAATPVVAWWLANLEQVRELDLLQFDPFGWNAVPLALLISLPLMPTVTIACFILTSVLVVSTRPAFASRVLLACVALQAGLVLGIDWFMDGLNAAGGSLIQSMRAARDGAEAERMAAWFAGQQEVSDAATGALIWIVGGYVVALVGSKFLSPVGSATTPGEDSTVHVPAAAAMFTPNADLPIPRASGATAAAVAGATVFDKSSYTVKPRMSLLRSAVRLRAAGYDIRSLPPERGATFVFTWSDGVLRRDRDDSPLLTVAAVAGVPMRRSYGVNHAVTGAPIGTIDPDGPDWDVRDPSRGTLTRVSRTEGRPGFLRWMAVGTGGDACRFTWTMGLGVTTAEVEIEFLPTAPPGFDRGVAIVLACLLEEQARRWARTAD
jgi:hypothetical protein